MHTPQSIKTRLNSYVDEALKIMEECLKDTQVDSDKRYRMASDFISVFLRMDNEKRKEEDHRESMRLKKINTLKSEFQLSELEGTSSDTDYQTSGTFSTKVVN